MRISDWSSDVCSSDLQRDEARRFVAVFRPHTRNADDDHAVEMARDREIVRRPPRLAAQPLERKDRDALQRLGNMEHRSEEHTSELQSLMRTSYAVFCLKKKKKKTKKKIQNTTKKSKKKDKKGKEHNHK